MHSPLGEMNSEQFLQDYWQKQPCLIRQAIRDFEPLLDGDDLAGLACEEMAESRLISGNIEDSDWQVRQGPFAESDFSALPEQNWTLLVQDVEKHYAPLLALMQQFDFIPNWRLDDLMISYAASGGSVGPHVDQYDVFLLQAQGTRRWQIADAYEPELLQDCPLNVLRHFDASQEWVLEAGDMLYLPPNIAHYGVALDPGMTWSIGSRAPSAADLLQALGEWLAFSADEGGRYSDPNIKSLNRAGEINPLALKDLQKMMLATVSESQNLNSFLTSFMSRYRLAHEPAPPPHTIECAVLQAALAEGQKLLRNPWTRLTWIETPGGACLYAAGQAFTCECWLAECLCKWDQPQLDTSRLDSAALETLTSMVNRGHFSLIPVE